MRELGASLTPILAGPEVRMRDEVDERGLAGPALQVQGRSLERQAALKGGGLHH